MNTAKTKNGKDNKAAAPKPKAEEANPPKDKAPDQALQESLGRDAYRHSIMLWKLLSYSLPLDLVTFPFLLVPAQIFPLELKSAVLLRAEFALFAFGALCLLTAFRQTLYQAILGFFVLRKKLFGKTEHSSWLLIALAVGISIVQMGAKFAALGPWVIVMVLAVGLLVLLLGRKAISEMSAEALDRLNDADLERDHIRISHFVIGIAPCAFARAFSVAAFIFALLSPSPWMEYIPLYACALVLLFWQKPQESFYLGHCKRCSRLISRALALHEHCSSCSRELNRGKTAISKPLPAEKKLG
jgi:hypothetical protein